MGVQDASHVTNLANIILFFDRVQYKLMQSITTFVLHTLNKFFLTLPVQIAVVNQPKLLVSFTYSRKRYKAVQGQGRNMEGVGYARAEK